MIPSVVSRCCFCRRRTSYSSPGPRRTSSRPDSECFSTGSGLRKLARLTGHNAKAQFLTAEVLDFQLMSAQKSVADFWIREFLKALPRMDSQTGSKHLASALQRAFDAASEDERDAVFAAIFTASSGMVRKPARGGYTNPRKRKENAEALALGGAPSRTIVDSPTAYPRGGRQAASSRRPAGVPLPCR